MKFGEKLREIREAKKMLQADLADKSGVPIGNIRNYEQERRAPLFSAVIKLARALGTDCTAFADCEDVAGEEKPKAKGKGKK